MYCLCFPRVVTQISLLTKYLAFIFIESKVIFCKNATWARWQTSPCNNSEETKEVNFFLTLQLKTLLEIPNPASSTGDAPTPSPNPVSGSLGDRTAGASPGYPIVFPLGPSAGTIASTDSGLAGLTFATMAVQPISNSIASNTALSMFDFNIFRPFFKPPLS